MFWLRGEAIRQGVVVDGVARTCRLNALADMTIKLARLLGLILNGRQVPQDGVGMTLLQETCCGCEEAEWSIEVNLRGNSGKYFRTFTFK